MVPVYKSRDTKEMFLCHPISLINTIPKILIKDKLLTYFQLRAMFSLSQYGFLPNKGTDLAVEIHINCIVDSVDKNKYTLAVYLDFQCAFDLVDDVDILLKKLRAYGIGGGGIIGITYYFFQK